VIGRNIAGVRGDVSKLEDLDRLYESVKAKGKLDVLGQRRHRRIRSPGNPHGAAFRQAFRSQRQRHAIHGSKALPLMNDGGSIILIGSVASVKGTASFGTYGDQGRGSQPGANLDSGVEGPSHSVECPNSGSDQDAPDGAPTRGHHGKARRHYSDGTNRRAGRSRQGSSVPGFGRFQLCYGHRTIRRWRQRSGLTGRDRSGSSGSEISADLTPG
jgi:hypothetical protein